MLTGLGRTWSEGETHKHSTCFQADAYVPTFASPKHIAAFRARENNFTMLTMQLERPTFHVGKRGNEK